MPSADGYPSHPRSKVQRYRNRAVYDYDFIHQVLDTASVVSVAFPPSLDSNADPFPALLPMIGCTGVYPAPSSTNDTPTPTPDASNNARDVYLHGYVSARLMRLAEGIARGDEDHDMPGLPVTLGATLVDGIVLSLTPNSHSYNYRSAVVQGFAMPVTEEAEKLWAMQLITDSVVPGRWANSRTPPTETEMTTTTILRVQVVSASGKRRDGGPNDEKEDMDDVEMRERVWTGVVPVYEARLEPVRAVTEAKSVPPAYLTDAIRSANEEREVKAVDAMGQMKKNRTGKSFFQKVLNLGG